jgi:hypothetical protein
MMALFITQATITEGYTVGIVTALTALVAIGWLERKWEEAEKV